MNTTDFPHLPQAVREALLRLVEAIQQSLSIPLPGEGPTPERYPRHLLELQILDTLAGIAPMPVTPVQLANLIRQPYADVTPTVQALCTLGTIQRVGRGYYSHGPGTLNPTRAKKRGGALGPPPTLAPSAQYSAQIARIVAQENPPSPIAPEGVTHDPASR
jgi:hypothetical protein